MKFFLSQYNSDRKNRICNFFLFFLKKKGKTATFWVTVYVFGVLT